MTATTELDGRTVYLARPIDFATLDPSYAADVERIRRLCADYGMVVFSPSDAFSVRSGTEANGYVDGINRKALETADLLIACYPECNSIGVPMEIQRAADLGIPTVVVTRVGRQSWALNGLDTGRTRITDRFQADDLYNLLPVMIKHGAPGAALRTLPFTAESPELLPRHGYPDDAGFDLITAEEVTIEPGRFGNIPCGCAVQLPAGVWGMITGRSSTWSRHRLHVPVSVIDTGYRGPLFVAAWNTSDVPFTAEVGTRIGQLIPLPNLAAGMVAARVQKLDGSDRGTNGFGSTGTY